MPTLIYEWNAYAIMFWIVYIAWCVLEMRGAVTHRAKTDAKKQDRGSLIILIVGLYTGLLLNFVCAGLFPGATISWHRSILISASLVLMVLGIILRQYAIRVLGKYFTFQVAMHADQKVVQQGPYQFIRHPAYSGALLTVLGIGLATTNWASLVSILFFSFIGYFYRVLVEERVLRTSLGQSYVEYMHHTKRFIPFVF